MLIVTGGIACGKSTFLEVARKMRLKCIDADEWFHDFKKTGTYSYIFKEFFDEQNISDVAFVHEKWEEYCKLIDLYFINQINLDEYFTNDLYDIIVIPDFFKRRLKLGTFDVLTIERPYNLKAAVERDSHRSRDLTVKIHQHQMDPGTRRSLADYVLENEGTKEEFEKECEEWLKLHLQDHLTRRM